MEKQIEILKKHIKMLELQQLRISEDLELVCGKIAKLEKSKCTGNLKTKNPHMRILK